LFPITYQESEHLMALCPHCESRITDVVIQDATIAGFGSPQWHGITYACPNCQKVLSVAIDPVALKNDVVHEFVDAVQTILRRHFTT